MVALEMEIKEHFKEKIIKNETNSVTDRVLETMTRQTSRSEGSYLGKHKGNVATGR